MKRIFMASILALVACTPVSSLLARKSKLEELSQAASKSCTTTASCRAALPCLKATAKALAELAERNRQVKDAQGLVESMEPTAWLDAVDGPAIAICPKTEVKR